MTDFTCCKSSVSCMEREMTRLERIAQRITFLAKGVQIKGVWYPLVPSGSKVTPNEITPEVRENTISGCGVKKREIHPSKNKDGSGGKKKQL